MWSFVQSKQQQQRWLWHAIDHETRKILAYVLSGHKDAEFLELKTLLAPFGITQFYTDDWGTYPRHLDPAVHTVGKANTQRIERLMHSLGHPPNECNSWPIGRGNRFPLGKWGAIAIIAVTED
jgi:IS1 family transposase